MTDLTKFKAKVCLTASGCLIHDDKVLLIKHRKLGIWLTPGGHIDPDELPHQAAEREFWEETGVKVKVLPHGLMDDTDSDDDHQVPSPISSNLHWVCKENYDHRVSSSKKKDQQNKWKKGCEQHANQFFLVEAVGSLDFKENEEEVDGISWFTLEEVEKVDTYQQIKNEIKHAFKVTSSR